MMQNAGKKTNAGQEIRMAEITADAGKEMGMFENLHEYETAPRFANALKEASRKHYGVAGVTWLNNLVKRYKELPDYISRGTNLFIKPAHTGQVARVARRFGLVAIAGELATEAGITGWKEGEAVEAIRKCFDAWLDVFGYGNKEEDSILERIRHFFQSQGDSRLEYLNAESNYPIHNKAGYIRSSGNGEKEYLIFPETFKKEFLGAFSQKNSYRYFKKTWMAKHIQPR